MKILITVKAYPSISKKYGETVCTAGITEEGKWIRIYPIKYRLLDYEKQFVKYEWIEIDLVRNVSDFRPESYRPQYIDLKDYKSFGVIKADGKFWTERKEYILRKVYYSFSELIKEAKDKSKCTSLATFKPNEIIDFVYEEVDRDWNNKKLDSINSKKSQMSLFDNENENDISKFEVVNKLPYKFSFIFSDIEGSKHKLMIEDWETGMLYWNSYIRHNGDEKLACEDVKKKYFVDFAKTKDYYFFLGTTKLHHNVAPNPFVIIGDFRPKPEIDESLF